MSTIIGNPITLGGGGTKLNIDYGQTPPTDTSKLWVPLSGKPDKVECTPTIQFGDNTIEKLGAVIPDKHKFGFSAIMYGDYIYFCGGASNSSFSYATKSITKVNIKTGVSTEISATLSIPIVSAFYATVNGKLYILGGVSTSELTAQKSVYVFDPSTETVSVKEELYVGLKRDVTQLMNSCVVVDSEIYIMGYYTAQAVRRSNILVYNTKSETLSDTGAHATNCGSACASVGRMIYCFGGVVPSSGAFVQTWFKYDVASNKVSAGGSYAFQYCSAFSLGGYIYIFQGHYGSYQNVIQKFNTETEQFENLSITTANKCGYRQILTFGLGAYICGGYAGNYFTSIEKFSANSPLTENHLFLQEDYGDTGLWSALKSKDTDLKVKVINAYLGDSNNIAQLTNAYLYDTASQSWKSLSGESYVADMQNALNMLGVN